MSTVEIPDYVGGQAFQISIAAGITVLEVGQPIVVDVEYRDAEIESGSEEGACLPVVVEVHEPDGLLLVQHVHTRTLPSSIEWTPKKSGAHLVRVAELFHNRWYGSLIVVVIGEKEVT